MAGRCMQGLSGEPILLGMTTLLTAGTISILELPISNSSNPLQLLHPLCQALSCHSCRSPRVINTSLSTLLLTLQGLNSQLSISVLFPEHSLAVFAGAQGSAQHVHPLVLITLLLTLQGPNGQLKPIPPEDDILPRRARSKEPISGLAGVGDADLALAIRLQDAEVDPDHARALQHGFSGQGPATRYVLPTRYFLVCCD